MRESLSKNFTRCAKKTPAKIFTKQKVPFVSSNVFLLQSLFVSRLGTDPVLNLLKRETISIKAKDLASEHTMNLAKIRSRNPSKVHFEYFDIMRKEQTRRENERKRRMELRSAQRSLEGSPGKTNLDISPFTIKIEDEGKDSSGMLVNGLNGEEIQRKSSQSDYILEPGNMKNRMVSLNYEDDLSLSRTSPKDTYFLGQIPKGTIQMNTSNEKELLESKNIEDQGELPGTQRSFESKIAKLKEKELEIPALLNLHRKRQQKDIGNFAKTLSVLQAAVMQKRPQSAIAQMQNPRVRRVLFAHPLSGSVNWHPKLKMVDIDKNRQFNTFDNGEFNHVLPHQPLIDLKESQTERHLYNSSTERCKTTTGLSKISEFSTGLIKGSPKQGWSFRVRSQGPQAQRNPLEIKGNCKEGRAPKFDMSPELPKNEYQFGKALKKARHLSGNKASSASRLGSGLNAKERSQKAFLLI